VVQIRLTDNEINYAYAVAQLRLDWADQAGAKHNYGIKPPDALKAHKIGCIGEMALAKHLRIAWGHTYYDKQANDVGGYEVRSTLRDNGCLLTHESDKPAIYVLATLDPVERVINLRGWQTLYETWHPTRWAANMPAPCFMTPQTLLHPMATLPPAI
jgi:hypothetical protein